MWGGFDQEACVCARVMFIESGTDTAGIAAANLFGKYMYEALQNLPPDISGRACSLRSSTKK